MVQVRWASWAVGMAMALALGVAGPAAADVTSDRAAAILLWPDVQVDTGDYFETVIQLTNVSREPVLLHCFYENANSHCKGGPNAGYVCDEPSDCCMASNGCGVCTAGWNETDFRIRLTPRQPIGWCASKGVAGFVDRFDDIASVDSKDLIEKFKIDGTRFGFQGIDGSSNAGSRIPPVPESQFTGSLRCIVINEDGSPKGENANVIEGHATLVGGHENNNPTQPDNASSNPPTLAKYNAIGIQAIDGAVNEDNKLCLGGEPNDECPDGAEYNGCPKHLLLNHFFDFATDPVTGKDSIETKLVLVPCSNDYLRQEPGSAVVQYLVWNEFEQRFSTSKSMECKQSIFLSNLDTSQRSRSIFSAGVAGTLTGQTKAQAIGSGILAIADEWHAGSSADFNVHFMAGREAPDVLTLP